VCHTTYLHTHPFPTRRSSDLGRVVKKADGSEDVAIMMVEAEATENSWNLIKAGAVKPSEEIVAGGLEAAKPFLKKLVEAQAEMRSEEHTSELQSRENLVCRLL